MPTVGPLYLPSLGVTPSASGLAANREDARREYIAAAREIDVIIATRASYMATNQQVHYEAHKRFDAAMYTLRRLDIDPDDVSVK